LTHMDKSPQNSFKYLNWLFTHEIGNPGPFKGIVHFEINC